MSHSKQINFLQLWKRRSIDIITDESYKGNSLLLDALETRLSGKYIICFALNNVSIEMILKTKM